MYEGAFPTPDANPSELLATDSPVIWLEHGEGVAPGAEVNVGRPADPEAVIEFLLKKVDEQLAVITSQQATYADQQALVMEQQALAAEQQATILAQAAKIAEHEGYAELLNQELDQLRGQLQVTREELDRQLADYEVVMQNQLVAERELDALKQRAGEKPKINLPFHTEQKLAKLGWNDGDDAMEKQAV